MTLSIFDFELPKLFSLFLSSTNVFLLFFDFLKLQKSKTEVDFAFCFFLKKLKPIGWISELEKNWKLYKTMNITKN